MDPFTQKMFERAQQRSKTLGVSKGADMPLTEINNTMSSDSASTATLDSNFYFNKGTSMTPEKSKVAYYNRSPNKKDMSLNSNNGRSPNKDQNRLQVSQRKIEIDNSKETSHKIHRQFSVDKENMDIEINITTGPNVDVQVEVKEQDINNDDEDDHATSEDEIVEDKNTNNIIRDSSRNRLQRLGALYSNTNDLSSPIHRTEGKFHADTSIAMDKSRQTKKVSKLNKLTALANSINNWEDDISHPGYNKKNVAPISSDCSPPHSIATNKDALPSNKKNSPLKNTSEMNKNYSPMKSDSSPMKSNAKNTKTLKWDDKVMNSLEAQGFQRRESSTTKLSYEYKNVGDQKMAKNSASSASITEENSNICRADRNVEKNKPKISTTAQNIKSGLVSGRTAAFENKAIENTVSVKKPQKDPAEMSLKERMQLFEKNKGTALIPKAPFALSAPINQIQDGNKTPKSQANQFQMPQSKGNIRKEIKVKDKIQELGFGCTTISETNIKNDILKQKQQDMDVIAQRYNKVERNNQTNVESMPPPPPPLPIQSQTQGSYKRISPPTTTERTEDEKKRQKLNSNRLYPVLSDLETTDGEMDNCTTATVSCDSEDEKKKYFANLSESPMEEEETEDDDADDISNVSLGREILQHCQRNEIKGSTNIAHKKKAVRYADQQEYYEDSSFNTSEESTGMEDYLDEALEDESDVTEDYNNSNKYGTKSSNSFSYQKPPKRFDGHKSVNEQNEATSEHPVTSELTVNKSSDDNMLTLVHTVSFYRKQQSNSNSVNNTPIRKVLHESKSKIEDVSSNAYSDEDCESTTSSELENAYLVDEKIKKLLDEICKQQQVIAQTSQALNLCAATIEFSGSSESVEGERHLLVATHRRQVALDEVQRLRVERTIRPVNSAKEKGSLIVKDINVPLRQDYVRKLSSDAISGHHLVCLLKYNENVIATKTVPTLPGLLAVKFPDVLSLNNVYADFRITLEVYGMTAQREILPHEIKYHINLNKKSGRRTPKKATDSRLIMPMVQSPGGPNVVRTPALVQYGFAIFSLKEIQRNSWALTQVSGVSPLDGIINMKIQCELSVSIEYRGFLTMFEDISGFGAWHRRWCFLNGHVLNYWKYPDDQNKKTPMGSIDLNSCISPRICTAPRDICARLNTMLLECQRPAQETDVESFLIIPKGKNTIVRYLLSADTKEERGEWCAHLNKAITLIRAWGTPQ